MSNGHTVCVVLSFPVSRPKAEEVLERWWKFKDSRKRYMRDRRAGRLPREGKS
jgi:hypothetical protein